MNINSSKPACALCESEKSSMVLESNNFIIHKCNDCGHRYLSLLRSTTEELESTYHAEYEGHRTDEFFASRIEKEVKENFLTRKSPGAKILDVGCGNGEFLFHAKAAGYKVLGLDISPGGIEICKTRGVDAMVADFLQFSPPELFDFITMWDVIEHLPNPTVFFEKANKLLKPNGYFVIKTPTLSNRTFAVARVFPQVAAGILKAPHHMQFYFKDSLESALNRVGFGEVDWLPGGRFRSISKSGSIRRKIKRKIRSNIEQFCGNDNLYCFAKKTAEI